jgi:hypothetical protein
VHEGVKFNRGPRFEDVARAAGRPISPVKIGVRNPLAPAGAKTKPGAAPLATTADSVAAVRHAAAAQAGQARQIIQSRQDAPATLPLLRTPRARAEHVHGAGDTPASPAAPDSAG